MPFITAVIVALLVFLAVFLLVSATQVQQAQVMIIERFGSYYRTLNSGLHFIVTIMDKPREIEWKFTREIYGKSASYIGMINRIDLRETVYDFPSQDVITRDNVNIKINALIYFQITDPLRVTYEVASLPMAIEKLTQTTLRNVIG